MGYFDQPWWSPAPWHYNGYSGTPNNQQGNPFSDNTGLGSTSGRQQADAGSGGGGGGSYGQQSANNSGTGSGGSGTGLNVLPIEGTQFDPNAGNNTGGGGGGGGGGAATSTGAVVNPLGPAPTFNAPQFHAPTAADLYNDPSYQSRLTAGSDALQASAAARGVLRTGGTLGDILKYGQDYASQEYGNNYNRALQAYDRQYQGAKDAYSPQLADWQRQWDLYQYQNLSAEQQSQAQARNYHPAPIPPPPDPSSYGL